MERERLLPQSEARTGNDDKENSLKKLRRQVKGVPLKGVLTVIGGVLVHLTLGSFYTYGNLNTYVTSYIRNASSPHDLTYKQGFWITPTVGGFQGLSMYFGGVIANRLGSQRWPILIGSLLLSAANIVSYWTVQVSFWFFLVTYGILQGTGVGLAYAAPMRICCEWFPNHKGLVNGLIVAGFGSGGAIFNQIITLYLNPDNLEASLPDPADPKSKYFGEQSILVKVPFIFVITGVIFLSMQLIGLLLMFEKNKEQSKFVAFFSKFMVAKKKDSRAPSNYQTVESRVDESYSYSNNNNSNCIQDADYKIPVGQTQQVLTPKEMLRTWHFWSLFVIFSCNGFGISYIAGFWKIYGLNYDDHFLGVIGSLSSVANGLGRILWGKLADKTCFKTAMVCVTALNMAFMLSFYATQEVGKYLYGFYVVCIFLSFSGTYSLLPTASVRTFGLKHLTKNYGLLFLSTVPQNIISLLVSNSLGDLAWYTQFWVVAGCFFVSFLMAVSYPTYTKDGFKI